MIKLPSQFKMIVHIEPDGGFWVEFPSLPGCYTQGDSLSQLQEQISDALLTYFDIPRQKAQQMTNYLEFEGEGVISPQQLQPMGV